MKWTRQEIRKQIIHGWMCESRRYGEFKQILPQWEIETLFVVIFCKDCGSFKEVSFSEIKPPEESGE